MDLISEYKCFGGFHRRYRHFSETTRCNMIFAVYLPPQVLSDSRVPVLYWLSGLTCTDENFATKAGAQRYAAEHGIVLVIPDTSPRGENVPNQDAVNIGFGAGFYVNATEEPWAKNYQMYDYIVKELPDLIERHFPVTQIRSIAGHSMGGHGALQIAVKNPDRYQSVSAFAPITSPTESMWGQAAFRTYLGSDRSAWAQYDSTELLKHAERVPPMKIDQGTADEFYPGQLNPEPFAKTAEERGFDLTFEKHEGYDHSYYFVSSFIGEHIAFHAEYLFQAA
ncbi:S-formylglutathione hydrolase [Neisseria chenwenguii]|uniref:S-formylglutathione hydrolase n=1 Tax=Neisseria chenwenguii TaxID=1853278 RepID=UPI0018F5B662|nr:S-formylglutathione hydrolase [Neisseria chenwenguii]